MTTPASSSYPLQTRLLALLALFAVCHVSGSAKCDSYPSLPHNCSCDRTKTEVLSIKCINVGLTTFPADLPSEIQHLNITGNNIKNITTVPYKELTELILDDNQLEILANGTFSNLGKLTSLHLKSNLIKSLNSGIFTGLRSLSVLDVSDNRLENILAGTFTRSELPALVWLLLPMNRIRNIDEGAFVNLTNVKILDLAINSLSSVPSKSLAAFPNLLRLNLGDNQLKGLLPYAFSGLKKLQDIRLYGNQIKETPLRAFDGLDSLTAVNLSSNSMKMFGSDLNGALLMNSLWLNNNSLHTLDDYLADWSRFSEIWLSDNPWNCDCNMKWMKQVRGVLVNRRNFT